MSDLFLENNENKFQSAIGYVLYIFFVFFSLIFLFQKGHW